MKALLKIEMNFNLRQPINQWIGIVFLGCLTLLVVMYYFAHKAEAVGSNLSSQSVYEEIFGADSVSN
jgi:hypothetical protein